MNYTNFNESYADLINLTLTLNSATYKEIVECFESVMGCDYEGLEERSAEIESFYANRLNYILTNANGLGYDVWKYFIKQADEAFGNTIGGQRKLRVGDDDFRREKE